MPESTATLERFLQGLEQVIKTNPQADTVMLHPTTAKQLGLVDGLPLLHGGRWYTVKVRDGGFIPLDKVVTIDLKKIDLLLPKPKPSSAITELSSEQQQIYNKFLKKKDEPKDPDV